MCFYQAEDGIRDLTVTGVQTCALPISIVGTLEPTVVVDLHGLRVDGERVARPDDHIGHLTGLERADDRVEPERPRGIDRDPAQCLVARDRYPGPLARVHRLRRLLVQALDPARAVGMNQRPPTRLLGER